jgi:hypothetical protein
MSSATLCIRAHFDGKVIVPDEPVTLPLGAPLDIQVRTSNNVSGEISEIMASAGNPNSAASASRALLNFQTTLSDVLQEKGMK